MAGTGASGKARGDLARATSTVALVVNERSGGSNPALLVERLRAFGAEVMRFDVDEVRGRGRVGRRAHRRRRRRREHRAGRGGGGCGRHSSRRGARRHGQRLRAPDGAPRRPHGRVQPRGARPEAALPRAGLDERRAPVRERRKRRPAGAGGPARELVEGPARAARLRGGRPARRPDREAAHLPRRVRRPGASGGRGVAGDGGGLRGVRRRRDAGGGGPGRRRPRRDRDRGGAAAGPDRSRLPAPERRR